MISGVLVYSDTKQQAIAHVQALALALLFIVRLNKHEIKEENDETCIYYRSDRQTRSCP